MQGQLLDHPDRKPGAKPSQYFQTAESMAQHCFYPPGSGQRGQRCNLRWKFGKVFLPDYPVAEGYNDQNDYLYGLSQQGLMARVLTFCR